MDAPWDQAVQRPRPDTEAVAIAMTHVRADESQIMRYVRQQWEAAVGANHVALDAWRRVWPQETRYCFTDDQYDTCREIEEHLAMATHLLSTLAPSLIGNIADAVMQGNMTAEGAETSYFAREDDHGD